MSPKEMGILMTEIGVETEIKAEEVSADSTESKGYIYVVERLNKIFSENWTADNIEGALNSVDIVVNSMAQDLTNYHKSVELRVIALDRAFRILPEFGGTTEQLLTAASEIENYLSS